MGSGGAPNFDAWVSTAWGSGAALECGGWGSGYVVGISNGASPAFYLDDFCAAYPKFFGPRTPINGCTLTLGSMAVIVPDTTGLAPGQFVQAIGLPPGSIITGVSAGQITVNNAAVASSSVSLQTYQQPPLPIVVIQMYLNLAASLPYDFWQESWTMAVMLFIAHYCTLYLQSDAEELQQSFQTVMHGEVPLGTVPGTAYTLLTSPIGGSLQSLTKNGLFLQPGVDYSLQGSSITLTTPTVDNDKLYAVWPVTQLVQQTAAQTPAQIAASGIANGILTSKSVGDVSAGYSLLSSLETWGAWGLTRYGQQLATLAKVIGGGPALVW